MSQQKRQKDKLSRRELLQFLGLTGGAIMGKTAIALLFDSVLQGMYQEAMAQTTGIVSRKHLTVFLAGAAPRHMFDMFFTPYTSTGFTPGPGMFTKFKANAAGTAYTEMEYATTLQKGINVPWMWQFPVPAAGGGTRSMTDLMNNMLSIRGFDAGAGDHEGAVAFLHHPLGAKTTVTALASDYSTAPIPAVTTYRGGYIFKSANPYTPMYLPENGNRIAALMDPFTRKTTAEFNGKRAALADSIKAATDAMNAHAAMIHPDAAALAKSQQGAEQLMTGALGDLTTVWNTLFNKYLDLVTRSMDMSVMMPGINDKPIGEPDLAKRPPGVADSMYAFNGRTLLHPDLRNVISPATGTALLGLAEQFAVAEFTLLNNISSSVAIAQGGISRIRILNVENNGNPYNWDYGNDEHSVGAMTSLLCTTLYNKAWAACLLELIDKLKAAGQFNNTLISMRGEFGRHGVPEMRGTDHAGHASNVAFYSGIIQGPMLLGNILNSTTDARGCYGQAMPVDPLGKALDLSHIAATQAALLGVPSPVTAESSIVSVSGSTVTPLIEKSRNV